MEVKQQLALRPISTYRRGGGGELDGMAASARERSSLTNASFRVYYSLCAGAVPFLWESAPGTPKRGAADGSPESPHPKTTATPGAATMLLPPLSPPPSFRSSSQLQRRRPSWTASAGGILRALLGVLGARKSRRKSRRHPALYYEPPLHCSPPD